MAYVQITVNSCRGECRRSCLFPTRCLKSFDTWHINSSHVVAAVNAANWCESVTRLITCGKTNSIVWHDRSRMIDFPILSGNGVWLFIWRRGCAWRLMETSDSELPFPWICTICFQRKRKSVKTNFRSKKTGLFVCLQPRLERRSSYDPADRFVNNVVNVR